MFQVVLLLVGHLFALVKAVEIDAVAFSLPTAPSLTGPFMSNSVLYEAERLHEGKIQTPQSYVSLGDGLYTVTSDSLVVNVAPCRPMVIANLKPRGCRGPDNCGRLTSIRRSLHNKLLIVDAYRGVFEVDPLTGVTTLVYNAKRLVNGRPSMYLNDIIVLPDGTMVMSDSSAHFTHAQEFWIRFEGRADGRLIGYNPLNMVAKEIMAGLAYPNGLELTHDGQAFLVAETGRARVMRVDLKTRSLLRRTYFVENLPGMPEHIRQSGRGTYWIGLSYARFLGSSPMDQYASQPASRNILAEHRTVEQLKLLFSPRGIAVELGANGDVIGSLHDSTGLKVSEITEVRENAGVVYVGTRYQNAVIRAILPDVANAHITVTSTLQVLRSRCQVSERQIPLARQQLQKQLQANKKPTTDDRALYNSLVPKTEQTEYSRKPMDTKKDSGLSNQLTRALPKVMKESQPKANPMVSEAHQALPQKSNRVVLKQEQNHHQQERHPGIPLQSLERFQQRLQQQRKRQQVQAQMAQHQSVRIRQASATGAHRAITRSQNQNNSIPLQTFQPIQHQQTSDSQRQNHPLQPITHMAKPQNFQHSPPRAQNRRRPSQTIHPRFSKPAAARPSVKVMTYHPQLRRDSLPRRHLFQPQQPQFSSTHHVGNGHSQSAFQAVSQRHQNSINFHPTLSPTESGASPGQENQTAPQQTSHNANEQVIPNAHALETQNGAGQINQEHIQSPMSTVSPINLNQQKPTTTSLSNSSAQTQQEQAAESEVFSPTVHQNQADSDMQQLGLFAGTQSQNVASGLSPPLGQEQQASTHAQGTLGGEQTAFLLPQNNGQNSFSGLSNPMDGFTQLGQATTQSPVSNIGGNIMDNQRTSLTEMNGRISDSTAQGPNSLSDFSTTFAGIPFQKESVQDPTLDTNLETNVSNPSQYHTNFDPSNLDLGANVQTITNINTDGRIIQQPGQMNTKGSAPQGGIPTASGGQVDLSFTNSKDGINGASQVGPSYANGPDSAFLGGFVPMPNGQINSGVYNVPRSSHDLGSYGIVSSVPDQQQNVQDLAYQNPFAASATEPSRQVLNGERIDVSDGRFPPIPAGKSNVPNPASGLMDTKPSLSSFSSLTIDQTINPPADKGQVTIVSYADGFSGLRHNNLSTYNVNDKSKMSINDNAGNVQQQQKNNIKMSQNPQSPGHIDSNLRRVNILTNTAINPAQNVPSTLFNRGRDIREVQMLQPLDKSHASLQSVNQKAQFSQSIPNKVVLKQGLQQLRNHLQFIKSNSPSSDSNSQTFNAQINQGQSVRQPTQTGSSSTNPISNRAVKEQQKSQTITELAAEIAENQGAPVAGFLEIKQSNGRSVRLALSQDVIRQALGQFHADGQGKTSSVSVGSSPDNTREMTPKKNSPGGAPPHSPLHNSAVGMNARSQVGGHQRQQKFNSNIRTGSAAHSYQDPPYNYAPPYSQGYQQPPQSASLQQLSTEGQGHQVPSPFLKSPFIQQPPPRNSMMPRPSQNSMMPQPSNNLPPQMASQNPPAFQQYNQPSVWLPPPPKPNSPTGPHFIPNGPGSEPSIQDLWQPDTLNGFSPHGQAPRPQQNSFSQGYQQRGPLSDPSHDRSHIPYSNPSGPPRPSPGGHTSW